MSYPPSQPHEPGADPYATGQGGPAPYPSGTYGEVPGQQTPSSTPAWSFDSTPGAAGPAGQPANAYGQPDWQPGQPMGPWQQPRKSRIGWIIGGVAAAMVAILVVGVVLVTTQAQRAREEEAAQEQQRIDDVTAAVQGVFDAIAAADAEAALALIDTSSDTSFVTDEMLAATGERGGPTDVVVTAPSYVSEYSSYETVDVSFTIGDTPVSTSYTVTSDDATGWRVTDILGDAYFYQDVTALDARLNGVPLTAMEVSLLPGTYELTSGLEYLSLGDDTTFVIGERYAIASPELEISLSEDGLSAFRGAVSDAVDACLASKDLDAGCGLDVPRTLSDGTVLEDGTLSRTLTDDAEETLASLEPTLYSSEPTIATSSYIGAVDIEADCRQDGDSGRCEIIFGPSLGSASVDMADPELTVTWD